MGYVKRNRVSVLCIPTRRSSHRRSCMVHTLLPLQPDYHLAMTPSKAQEMFEMLVGELKEQYVASKVSQGQFGAMMDVQLVNDGPVTLMLDSKNRENRDPTASGDMSPTLSGGAAAVNSTKAELPISATAPSEK